MDEQQPKQVRDGKPERDSVAAENPHQCSKSREARNDRESHSGQLVFSEVTRRATTSLNARSHAPGFCQCSVLPGFENQ